MKRKVVVIGANEYQDPLIKKAKEEGFETHVFAWRCQDPGEKSADCFYPVSIVEKEEILSICRQIGPDAITTIGSDLAAVTANYAANALGLPGNPPETAVLAAHKYEMRKAFRDASLRVPRFLMADLSGSLNAENECGNPEGSREETRTEWKDFAEQIRSLSLPLIIKPVDRSGSRGVSRIDDYQSAEKAIREAAEVSFAKQVIAEEYIDGDEYSCECISHGGKHWMLAVTRKYTSGEHFVEIAHVQPCGLDQDRIRQVQETVFAALEALHIREGASHTEFKIDREGQIRLIEAGARMGGDCIGSALVPMTTGFDYVKMALDTALGKEPDFQAKPSDIPGRGNAALIRYIFTKEDAEHFRKLQKEHPEWIACCCIPEETAKQHEEAAGNDSQGKNGSKPGLPQDSSTRHGYYILRGEDAAGLVLAAGLDG